MVTLNRIYTRTGDQGFTGLVGGARISKTAPRVAAYGDVDELNAHLGMCRTLTSSESIKRSCAHVLRSWLLGKRLRQDTDAKRIPITEKLAVIQNQLFDIGSELASPAGSTWEGIPKTTAAQVAQLESWIDELNSYLPELKSFVLPGGNLLNAHLHIARTVCRRAERSVLCLKSTDEVSESILIYLNRLSDLLFVMSRYAALVEGAPEYLWVPGASSPDIRNLP